MGKDSIVIKKKTRTNVFLPLRVSILYFSYFCKYPFISLQLIICQYFGQTQKNISKLKTKSTQPNSGPIKSLQSESCQELSGQIDKRYQPKISFHYVSYKLMS